MEDLEWQYTKPVKRPVPREMERLEASFAPRIRPYNVFEYMDPQIHDMEPTEYFVGYSNEVTAIGFAKDLDNLGDLPLTMQFGTYEEQVGREIYIGCTVIVKSYARMFIEKDSRFLKIIDKYATFKDLFFNGRPRAHTLATEWAIVHKPRIERSLGYVVDFQSNVHRNNRCYFSGSVFDQENQLEVEVYTDQWPLYIKKEVPIGTGVVLSWIKVDEPHSSYFSFPANQILLPSGASRLDLKDVKDLPNIDYWLAWVDTDFKASRF